MLNKFRELIGSSSSIQVRNRCCVEQADNMSLVCIHFLTGLGALVWIELVLGKRCVWVPWECFRTERRRNVGDAQVLAELQRLIETVPIDSNIEKQLKHPKLSYFVTGKQSSTKGWELRLSCLTVQNNNILHIKEEDKVVTQ